ncbi:hypothetical protein LCGC14_1031590 [marine sediment metagenome]|uniref:Uncharacterized protein n=1 Tax=marine sediment metagenome TaxID=412755 RepID=A0A0F9MUE3_9ZZZZ
MTPAEKKLRERLQPFIEQDMQVTAELENQMMRLLNAANVRAMRVIEPGAEEGGEDIFEMPDTCSNWACHKALLENRGQFRVCSSCGASYGKAT